MLMLDVSCGCALMVAAVAAYGSYERPCEFALLGGADPVGAGLWSLSVDGCYWPLWGCSRPAGQPPSPPRETIVPTALGWFGRIDMLVNMLRSLGNRHGVTRPGGDRGTRPRLPHPQVAVELIWSSRRARPAARDAVGGVARRGSRPGTRRTSRVRRRWWHRNGLRPRPASEHNIRTCRTAHVKRLSAWR
jgi:hypothetical protein